MKKTYLFLVLLFCATVLFSTFISAAAADGSITLSEVSANPGEDVTLDLSIADNPGVAYLKFTFTYDSNLLTYVSNAKPNENFSEWQLNVNNPGEIIAIWIDSNGENNTSEGAVLNLSFHVDDSASGELPLSVTLNEAWDENDDPVSFSVSSGKVIIQADPATLTPTATATFTPTATPTQTPIPTFTVTWKNYDGTVLSTDQVQLGTIPEFTGETPTRVDPEDRKVYTFAGWDPEVTAVNGVAEYTAVFTESDRIYKVTVTSNEYGTAYADPTEGKAGTEVTLYATPKDNCRFVSWQVVKGGVTVDGGKFVILYADVEVQAIFEEVKDPFELNVTINNIMGTGTKGAPEDISKTRLTPMIILKSEGHSTSSGLISVMVNPGNKQLELKVTFANKVPNLSSALYNVFVEGLSKYVSSAGKSDNKYKLTYNAWINKKGGITLNLIWTDRTWKPEEQYVVPLPEDEIGAYKLDPFGNKEYLLFHTYDICMRWLGNDELCSGYERCFHKELPYIYDKNKIRYGYDWQQP